MSDIPLVPGFAPQDFCYLLEKSNTKMTLHNLIAIKNQSKRNINNERPLLVLLSTYCWRVENKLRVSVTLISSFTIVTSPDQSIRSFYSRFHLSVPKWNKMIGTLCKKICENRNNCYWTLFFLLFLILKIIAYRFLIIWNRTKKKL